MPPVPGRLLTRLRLRLRCAHPGRTRGTIASATNPGSASSTWPGRCTRWGARRRSARAPWRSARRCSPRGRGGHQHRARHRLLDALGEDGLERLELAIAAKAGRGLSEQRPRALHGLSFGPELEDALVIDHLEAAIEQRGGHGVDPDRRGGCLLQTPASSGRRRALTFQGWGETTFVTAIGCPGSGYRGALRPHFELGLAGASRWSRRAFGAKSSSLFPCVRRDPYTSPWRRRGCSSNR
jgi:hypothetical protein